ncbi:MAG TPA: asparagine synthase (glutamine-hydrolyzing) [Candidatus Eisenbacteria bacterium]|nr:asparagine synthase (glutamine-hydrolyzing) [Candidatus Eisenbacteria bacterium]
MCGIAGIVELRGAVPDRGTLERMASLLAHRGPDEQGIAVIGQTGLAHRRLSIIDLSGGRQPMADATGTLTLLFNGEIYNFMDVRSELESRGHRFATRSDTEVLLQAYMEWGTDCVLRLNGMYAFVIWDAPRRRLFAARDRLGKKPFYYALTPDRFVFGSELKAVLAAPGVPRDVDPAAVDEFLSRYYVGGARTILRGVAKLPPAHWLSLEEGRLTVQRYWRPAFRPDHPPRREEEYLEELEGLFRDAVRRRMISDVPLGAFLSGGVDSSAVVAMMAAEGGPAVKTFTVGFEEAGYSEIEDARAVARHLGTDHHEETVRPDAIAILPDLVWHYDEPFGDSSMVPTWYVARMARRHVTVALSGDGGDELFAGYTRYQRALEDRRLDWIPGPLKRRVLAPLAEALPAGAPARNRLYAAAHHSVLTGGYDLGLYPYIKSWLYAPAMRAEVGNGGGNGGAALPAGLTRADLEPLDLVSRLQWIDTVAYLPDDILTKVDRASMAHSLEARAPLLDYTLVDFMARVPSGLKLRGGVSKYLFRKMLAKRLPEAVFTKRKQGFAVPKGEWFRRDLKAVARERLLDPRTLARGYFRPERIREVLQLHEAGQRDYSDWIWCLLILEEWHRTFMDPATRRI